MTESGIKQRRGPLAALRRFMELRIRIGAVFCLYGGFHLSNIAAEHSSDAVRDQNLFAGFGWFVAGLFVFIVGVLTAVQSIRTEN